MAYCRKCGQKNPDNSAFCFACGTPLRKDNTSQESDYADRSTESDEGATSERLNIPSQGEDEPQTLNNNAPQNNGIMDGLAGLIKNHILTIGVCVVAVILLFWVYKSCTAKFNANESTTEKLVNTDEQVNDFDDFETDEPTGQETEPETDLKVEENMEPPTDEEPAVEIEVEEEEAKEVAVDEQDTPKEDEATTKTTTKTSTKTTTKATTNTTTNTTDTKKVYDIVEQMPSYPGGRSAMLSFFSNNLVYPEAAQKRGVQGIVTISFVVEPDGSLTNLKVLRSVDPDLAKEALRVVKMMPRWQPGKKDGKSVRVKYTLPITFKF